MVKLTKEIILSRARAQDLNGVKTLNCWGSELTDVTILKDVANVEVINASVNEITSLEVFSCCHNLKELYLRRNKIKTVDELSHLADLKDLKFLWLSGNPFCESLSSEEYRQTVIKILPQIQKLDNNVVTSNELQMALQSTLESRETDACDVENDVTSEAIAENATNPGDLNSSSKSRNSPHEVSQNLTPEKRSLGPETSLVANKTSDSTPSKSSSMSIPRSNSPDMSKVSKNLSSSVTPNVSMSIPAEEPTLSTPETKPSPKTEVSLSTGEPAPILNSSSSSKVTSSLPIADSLQETNKLRRELGLQPISPEKYKLSTTQPYKPPKKQKKHSTKNNILRASLALVEEMDLMSLLALQDAVQEKLELFELEESEEICNNAAEKGLMKCAGSSAQTWFITKFNRYTTSRELLPS